MRGCECYGSYGIVEVRFMERDSVMLRVPELLDGITGRSQSDDVV